MLHHSNVELALGTAQFGMNYGISGRGSAIPMHEIQNILARAWDMGVRVIDTATVYGDIEEKLRDLIAPYPYDVVSKIPAIPCKNNTNAIEDFVLESIQRTMTRLKGCLTAILFHNSDDLLDQTGEVAWQSALKATENTNIKLGISGYSPDDVARARARYPLSVAQIPGNALDQRIVSSNNLDGVELYLRSVFLQGILLLEPSDVAIKLPRALTVSHAWHVWCKEHQMKPLQAALSIAKGLPGVRYCVVGVDRLSHLEEIMEAWSCAIPMNAPEVAINNNDILDPRRWSSLVN